MSVPTQLLWPRDPHTEAKHRILRGYLDAWWPILLSRNELATFADGYAGPGEYAGREDGSPVIALRSLLNHEPPVRLAGKRAQFVFIEERQDRLQHCLGTIDERIGALPNEIAIASRVGRCEDELLPALTDCRAFSHPILANLDPFSAGVPYEVIRAIAANRSSEVLISFMMQWFIRFSGHDHLELGDAQFGSAEWREVADVESDQKRTWLIEHYRTRIHEAGFAHTVWFELVDEGGHAFALIFATNNRLGLEKMKESFWRVDPVRGIHFRDPRDPGQLKFDVGDDPHLATLRNLLTVQLEGQTNVLVDDLRDWTTESTVFLPTHSMTALRELRAQQRLTVDITGPLQRRARVTLVDPPPLQSEDSDTPQQGELF